ncbi:hypothetical protein DdX_05702 [Ditylenchus destructor]|uniref:Uncharacterized protein n=1 Tax=Ditylenchus destructor TaxID=166010 RepID=A0AAD4ND42_9BILA|nr:hypothetical protein DdX_05702 [Ditylenchus destructor]
MQSLVAILDESDNPAFTAPSNYHFGNVLSTDPNRSWLTVQSGSARDGFYDHLWTRHHRDQFSNSINPATIKSSDTAP